MSSLILDCDLMKYPNSGLYHYCLNLGQYVNDVLVQRGQQTMKFYVPPQEANTFNKKDTIVEKEFHHLVKPFLWNCKIWHAPFQSGRIVPHANRSIKVVLTIHDINSLHEGKSLLEQEKNIAHIQRLIDRSDAIVCISEFTKNDVLTHCDVKNKPVYVIYNGNNPLAVPLLSSSSYMPARPFLFGIGYVNRKKNFHVLLSLLENTDFELVIAGRLDEPDYISFIEEAALTRGLRERVRILGPVSETEKAWYLTNCAAFVFPSLAEGFGLPVVEAMSLGKPLFLSCCTSLPEIAGDAAFYFENFDAAHMQHVFTNGLQQYQQNGMSEKIKAKSLQFNWEKTAEKYVDLYQSLY